MIKVLVLLEPLVGSAYVQGAAQVYATRGET